MSSLLKKAMSCVRWVRYHGNASLDAGLVDALLVKKRNKIEFCNFFVGHLYKKDVPRAQRMTYLGYWQLQTLLDVLNPDEHRDYCRDKQKQKMLCADAGIPVAELYGVLHDQHGEAVDGAPLRSLQDLERLLLAQGLDTCVLKPPDESEGDGFAIFHVGGDASGYASKYHIDSRTDVSGLPFLSRSGYLCEALIRQHPDMAAINPHGVNTFRFWTYRNGDEVRVLGAYMRTPAIRIPVDNTAAGGICVNVDIHAGKLISHCYAPDPPFEVFEEHPVTGHPVKGMEPPHWPQVIRMVEQVAMAYDNLRLLALDVAIAEEGPVCIEVNSAGLHQGQFLIGYGFGDLPEARQMLAEGTI